MSGTALVRVELEFADGTIKRLTGQDAERWLEKVNNVVVGVEPRLGCPQIPEFPWEIWRRSTESDG